MRTKSLLFVVAILLVVGCAKRPSTAAAKVTESPVEAAPPAKGTDAAKVAEGDAAFASRLSIDSLQKALDAWTAAATPGSDPAVDERLARGFFFLGDAHLAAEPRRDEAVAAFTRGEEAALRALLARSPDFAKARRDGPPEAAFGEVPAMGLTALYWYAANALFGAERSGLSTVLARHGELRAALERARSIDPGYHFGGPDRLLGLLDALCPSFAGGDLPRARNHFETSLKLAPQFAPTQLLLAAHLAPRLGDRALFDTALAEVQAAKPESAPDASAEIRVAQQQAAELRARADELF